jgi:hypothetical protein
MTITISERASAQFFVSRHFIAYSLGVNDDAAASRCDRSHRLSRASTRSTCTASTGRARFMARDTGCWPGSG